MKSVPSDYVALASYLQGHLDSEQGALEAYERIVEKRDDDMITYLLRSILRDEARHHEVFTEMVNSLESRIRWQTIEPALPPRPHAVEDRDELLAATDRLIELEEQDVKELRQLRRAWEKAQGDFAMWAVLVEAAEFDTRKHISILKHVRRMAQDAPAPS